MCSECLLEENAAGWLMLWIFPGISLRQYFTIDVLDQYFASSVNRAGVATHYR